MESPSPPSRAAAATGGRTLHDDVPRYAGGLRDLGGGVLAWLSPNGGWGESNAGLVVGHGASLLVDTLWDVALTRRMLQAMAPHTERAPIRQVVHTHSDGDHWWGNELLRGGEIIATHPAAAAMRHDQPRRMRLLGRIARGTRLAGGLPVTRARRERWRWVAAYLDAMGRPFDFGGIRPVLPSRSFSGTLALEVGGRRAELIEVGPAHTEGDLVVHLPDERTMFAGDVLFVGSTPVLWDGSVQGWLAALDRIVALRPEVIVPGHGPVTDLAGVDAVRHYWMFLESAARRRFGQGLSAAEAALDIAGGDGFGRQPFAGWEHPERIAINVHSLYRSFRGRRTHMGAAERLRVLSRAALLARRLFPASAGAR